MKLWFSLLSISALTLAGAAAQAQTATPSRIGGHFALETVQGETITERTYRGQWQLIYFGYTACPDVCPAVLANVSFALDALGPLGQKIQPIFISIDAARDSAQSVAAYAQHFNTRIVGLAGTAEQTQPAARSYHVYYKTRDLGGGAVTIDHSSFLFLMKPDGEFAALLSGDLPNHRLVDELRQRVQ